MKLVIAAVVLVAPAVAAADPETDSAVAQLTLSARNAARDGRCEAIVVLGARVRQLDPDYHAQVFLDDPLIAGCDPASTRARPVVVLRTVDSDRDEPPIVTPPARQRDLPPGVERSASTALGLSGGATLAGAALLVLAGKHENIPLAVGGIAGLLVGPTVGHIYVGHMWNRGLGIRLASLATTAVGVGLAISCQERQPCGSGTKDLGGGLIGIGALGLAAGTVYEIALVSRAVDRHNQRARAQLAIAPIAAPQTAGLVVAGQF